jgi:exosortase/archaeosortase family protein
MTPLVGAHRARRPLVWWESAKATRRQCQQWWSELPSRTRTTIQWAALIVSVIVAYSYSLTTLVQTAGLETPLAYVSLVPLIALGLAAVRARPTRPEPAIHDRQVDYIVGVPLIILAMAINLWLPGKLSAMFWVWRLDLFSLPFFVAGAVSIIFGTRILWRQKLAICYLFLAWPLPYTILLLRVLNAFTALTLAALRSALQVLPFATGGAAGDAVFTVTHHGQPFQLSVVSACSGVNGVVGFLLVGVAFGAIVTGPKLRKALWLVGGMLLLWVTNLIRLLFIFWAGRQWGEHIAIDVLHPFIGLLLFSLGVLTMVVVLRPIGLQIGASPGVGRAVDPSTRAAKPAVPHLYLAAVLLALAALIVGTADINLRSYDLVADASGEPRLAAYSTAPISPPGWDSHLSATFDWAKPLFGDDSTWNRYTFTSTGGGGDLHANYGVTFDVINTGDLESFSAYGIEACYQFHGFSLADVAEVKLAGGITGQTIAYTAYHQSWSIVYWIVPVKSAGQTIRYERLVLYLLNAPGVANVQLPLGTHISNLSGALGNWPQGRELATNRAFLVAFADELLKAQASPAAVQLALSHAATPEAPSTDPRVAAGTSAVGATAPAATAETTAPAGSNSPRGTAFVSVTP